MVPRNTTGCTPPICYSASSGPTIWYRRPRDWYFMFFIRMDRGGSFHMYPDLGGPFQSLEEVDAAIAHHLDKLKRQAMCNEQDDISFVERLDHAHELLDVVKSLWISEGARKYYHFNFTTRVKEAGDVYGCACNLFFAEVMQMEKDGDWVVTCCCMIGPNDNGIPCSSTCADCLWPFTRARWLRPLRPRPSRIALAVLIDCCAAPLAEGFVPFYLEAGDTPDAGVDDYGDFVPTMELKRLIPAVDYTK
nr:unnamed protein product [Digitaria exilis]